MFNIPRTLKENAIPILIIVVMVLVGYHELFFGADLFCYKDQFINSGWTYGNSLGNGWRPEKGFGISFFYADAGSWHPWAVLSLWERIFHSRVVAYNTSVVILDILAAIAVYFFLRRVAPVLSKKAACLLSPLIIFSVGQNTVHFSRISISSIVGVALLLLLLYDFYRQSKLLHFFYATLLFWYVIFLGSFLTFSVLPSMGFVFTGLYCIYYKASWKKIFSKYILIFFIGGVGTLLLGFWEFYSLFVESSLVGYLREKMYTFSFGVIPDIKAIGRYILNFIQFYSIPTDIRFLGVGWRPFFYSWNVAVIFPLVFIFFLFRRASTFWEFSLKWLLAVFYLSHALSLIPAVASAISILSVKTRGLFSFYGTSWAIFVFPLQIGLIGVFLTKIAKNDFEIKRLWGRRIQGGIACLLFIFYILLTVFAFFALFIPEILPALSTSFIERFASGGLGRYPKDFLVYGILNNVRALQNSMHWHSLLFYFLCALLVFFFIRKRWFSFARNRISLFAGILLITGILSSWTVYPLNRKLPVWEEIAPELPEFKPTDRFYYVGAKRLSEQPMDSNTLKELKQKAEAAGGILKLMEKRGGYLESPGLRLHGVKSFTQKDVGEFIYHIFNGDGVKRIESIRNLAGGPMISSELLDMGAVSYYYSTEEIPNLSKNLSLYAKAEPIYIYKNHTAWPYFYLAERLDIKEEGRHLKDVKRGTAYLAEKDLFKLPENAGNSSIRLKEFSYGKMVFDFQGKSEEFLVVADAWHPFWRANAEKRDLPVIKANEIFKGVRLPPGKYTFTLFFDNSPYLPGVYVSGISWILFLSGLILIQNKKRREIK